MFDKQSRLHWIHDNQNYIKSIGSKAFICDEGSVNSFYFDNKVFTFLAYFKLLRRLLRLNRSTIKRLGNGSVLIIYNYKILVWKDGNLKVKINLPFTRSIHSETISIENNELVVGEYGNSKNSHSVGVYISNDFGETWRKQNLIKKGIVRNILSVKYDIYKSEYWVFFGQSKNESRIIVYSKEWRKLKVIGKKHFNFRAISSLFFKDHVLWFLNNPGGKSFVFKYDRKNNIFERGFEFPGPVWYSFISDNRYFLSTASEEGSIEKVFLLSSVDGEKWDIISSYEKDRLNKKYFLYGLLSFPDQVVKNDRIMVYGEAIKGYDGKCFMQNLKQKKIVIVLEKFSTCEDIFLLNNNDVNFEYLLRYMEIFKEDLISVYRSNFSSNWEKKLNISFTLMYKYYIKTNDIRIFNMLHKTKRTIKKLNIYYEKSKMCVLITSNFERMKNEE